MRKIDKIRVNVTRHACVGNSNIERAKALLKSSDVNCLHLVKGLMPLHMAILNDNFDVACLLMSAPKIDVNWYDSEGWTPLLSYLTIPARACFDGYPVVALQCREVEHRISYADDYF